MNKQSFITILLIIFMSMIEKKAIAYDIAVANADGVTIYYVWTNNRTELAVSYNSTKPYSGDVVIPESVIFQGNTYSVTSIGLSAFESDHGLNSVTIPNSVKYIDRLAFRGCSGLAYVTIPNSVTSIGISAFRGCTSLNSINIPKNVTSIGEHAFFDCSSLTSVNIHSCTIAIGFNAFANCGKFVTNLYLDNVTDIFNNEVTSSFNQVALYNNKGDEIKELVIPNDMTTIKDYAFCNCSGLTSVTIPNSVKSIGKNAFEYCSGLTSLTIPNSVTSIGEFAFYGSGVTSVVIGSGVTTIGEGALNYANLTKTIWLTNTPPSGCGNASGAINYVSNDQFTFRNQVKYQFLSSYFDVDGIRYVPVSPSDKTCDAIDCVYNEIAANTKISSNVVYKGVTMHVKDIKPYLAYNNNYIKTLIVDNDGELADYAFSNCINMKSVSFGKKISAIGISAFSGCSALEAVEIPDIVTVLNDYAFSRCTSLKEMKIGSNVKTINEYALSGCSALPSITIPSAVTDIKFSVFNNCTSLMNVIFTESETELNLDSNEIRDDDGITNGNPLFSSCPLDSVFIGRNINYYISPFSRNLSLRAVMFADKETEISPNEFYGCTNLQRVIIGDGVNTIGDWAFSGCSSLKYFAFGSKVADIGQEAFSDCAAVVEISSKAKSAPTCGSQALDDINKWECKLYVPDGCMAAYEAADQWKDFFFKEVGEGTVSHGECGEQIVKKCETPTITLTGDKLSFACATEDVIFHYTVSHSDVQNGASSKDVNLTQTYIIAVYASKDGYNDSEVAKATIKASGNGLLGDVNKDGKVDVADHVKLSEIILNQNIK